MDGTHRRWAVVLLVLLTVIAGCTGGAGSNDGGNLAAGGDGEAGGGGGDSFQGQSGEVERTAMATGTPMAEDAKRQPGGGSDYSAAQFAQRQLILTGQVAIEVEDFEAARRNLTAATESYGGFVSDTRQEVNRVDNETWTEGQVVLRVPRENFTALYERTITEGELVEAEKNTQDVTDQLVDIRARLENLRAERDQLRRLYERANETEDVLRVQRRLSDVQGEIERLEARQQALRQRVALSTITVRLAEPRPEPDRVVPDRWYDVPLLAAFLESVDGVVVTLRAISVAVAYAAPYVLVFGVPLAAVGYVVRERRGPRPPGRLRRRFRRGGDGGAAGEPPEAEPPTEPDEPDVEDADDADAGGPDEDVDGQADGDDEAR